jgi:glycogenin glucosyltransferase
MRPLPCGSEGVTSPTYVAQAPKTSATTALTEPTLNVNTTTKPESRPTITIQEPSYQGSMPSIEKAETSPTHETPLAPSEEEKDVLET